MIKLSVIIPTRSRYSNLKHVLNALFNQSYEDYEVIVSDDNSNDETQSVINEYRNRGKLKYVFNNYKPYSWNASIPRNLGALISDPESSALVFVDSDVVLPRTALEHYAQDLEKDSNRVIISPYHFYAEGNEKIQVEDVRWKKFNEVSVDDTFDTAMDGLACFGGNICIPKNIFWQVKGFDEDVNIGLEDGSMGLKLWKKKTKFSYDIRILGKHLYHPTPPDRFPPDMQEQIDNLNLKHFGTKTPDYGIIEASRETYASWGIPNWEPPELWRKNQLNFMLKVKKTE